MADGEAADGPKRKRNGRAAAAALKDGSDTSAPPDYDALAREFLHATSAGRALRSIADLVRRMRDGAAAEGEGSSAIRTLNGAARAAGAAGEHLRRVPILTVLEALGAPAPAEVGAPHRDALNDFLRLHLGDRFDTTLLALDRLAAGLERAAKATRRRPRGAPQRPKVLPVALDQLERLWWQHRQQAPTQSINSGGFGGLAREVLSAAPCNYREGTVRKAVAAYLAEPSRPAATAHKAPPSVAPPSIGTALIVSDPHPLAEELARQLEADVARVDCVPFPDLGNAAPDAATAVAKDGLDLLLILCLGSPVTKGTVRKPRVLASTAWSSATRGLATLPERLERLVAAYRHRLRAVGGRVVVVMPEPSSVAATAGRDGYGAASAFAAVVTLVRLLATDLARDGIHVAAIHPGWGRDAEGLPQRHAQPRVTAAVLRETIAKLGDEQRGRLTDLYGGRLPEI